MQTSAYTICIHTCRETSFLWEQLFALTIVYFQCVTEESILLISSKPRKAVSKESNNSKIEAFPIKITLKHLKFIFTGTILH